MAYFSNRVLNAAARGPVPVCIRSGYPDDRDLIVAVVSGEPTEVDAARLAQEHGLKLYLVGEDWFLAPLDWL